MQKTTDPTVKAGWGTIIAAWIVFLWPIPGVSTVLGGLLSSVAFIVSIVVIAKGHAGDGIAQLAVNLLGSPVVYAIGLGVYALLA